MYKGSFCRAMRKGIIRGRGMKRGKDRGKGKGKSMGKFLTNEKGMSRGNWYCLA